MKGKKDIVKGFSPDKLCLPWCFYVIIFLYNIFNSFLDCINFSCQVRWFTPVRPAWLAGISKGRRTYQDIKSKSRLYSEFQAHLGYKENLSKASLPLGSLIQSTQNSFSLCSKTGVPNHLYFIYKWIIISQYLYFPCYS